jgi:hypothetical protein|tara:strand:+ start:190 stop:606 length:417 start_codon:yes stop_codon:yes gene_type:complete
MTIVGFNFTSMNAEKNDTIKGKVNINNNVAIKDVKEKDLALGSNKQKSLKFEFEFTSKYDPNMGHITLIGDILYIEEGKKIKEILDGWKKDKKLPKEITGKVLNTVLGKCNVQALILSEQLNLPAPIPMPKVQVADQK